MHKCDKAVSILRWLVIIGFGLQVMTGLVWMVRNFGTLQLFGETAELVRFSGTLQSAEGGDLLYPALLLPIRVLGGVLGIPWYCLMYLLQLGFGFFSGYFALRSLRLFGGDRRFCVSGSLVVLTFPHMMQCHLAILPYSLLSSLLLIETGVLARSVRRMIPLPERYTLRGKAAAGDMALVGLLWLLTSLCDATFFYPGMIPVAGLLLLQLLQMKPGKRLQLLYPVLVAVLYFGLIPGIMSLARGDGQIKMPGRPAEQVFFERTAWTGAIANPARWPAVLRETLGDEMLLSVSKDPDDIREVLEPALEASEGVIRAREIYRQVARDAWTYYRGDLLRDIRTDLAGYTLPPLITAMQLRGRGYESYAVRNYDVMKRQTPLLTAFYMDYAQWWFVPAFLSAAATVFLTLMSEKKRAGKITLFETPMWKFGILISVFFLGIVTALTLSGSADQDYKKAVFLTALWILLILRGTFPKTAPTGETK
ncbi:MAG: hypothetical protein K5891_02920 [Lachnospiraceae bacterium]|nr:hypothetical protein [Lachnospiraceae bacterium]